LENGRAKKTEGQKKKRGELASNEQQLTLF
jgi:hypothetical protein